MPANALLYSRLGSLQIPYRTHPGGLSVSRTIGDLEAKSEKYGGNPGVVIATPDVISFKLEENHDFVFLGCIFIHRFR